MQHLEGHVAPVPEIIVEVHRGHAAGAEFELEPNGSSHNASSICAALCTVGTSRISTSRIVGISMTGGLGSASQSSGISITAAKEAVANTHKTAAGRNVGTTRQVTLELRRAN